jgi:hypothetical protein
MRLIIYIALCIAIGGCGLAYQQKRDELVRRSTVSDWGKLDSNHQTKEKAVILRMLKDPDSARIRFTEPTRGTDWINDEPVLAWFSHVFVNARNSFGGYTGEQSFAFSYKCNSSGDCQPIDYAIPADNDPTELKWQGN